MEIIFYLINVIIPTNKHPININKHIKSINLKKNEYTKPYIIKFLLGVQYECGTFSLISPQQKHTSRFLPIIRFTHYAL